MSGRVVAVHASRTHTFSKVPQPSITLVKDRGVEGDAHFGATVKHRSRVQRDPGQPNLRQVHLMHRELFDELARRGFDVGPSDLGENVTTEGIDLLGLPEGTRLHLGAEAIVRITGLRNPCAQIDAFRQGLMSAVLDRASDGSLVRKAGVMAVVVAGGTVRPDDAIRIVRPAPPHRPLAPV